MKAVEQVRDLGIAQALTKGACPICALLKQFQSQLIDDPEEVDRLCNYHAWAIAHATPGGKAVDIFARVLNYAESHAGGNLLCDICFRLQQEEEIRIREMAKELASRTTFMEWMLQHGGICLNHATKLKTFLPIRLQYFITKIVQREFAELKGELDEYRLQLEQGCKAGWGGLGKVAELIVSQRGITR